MSDDAPDKPARVVRLRPKTQPARDDDPQVLSDNEQTRADSDQTLSDSDQTSADSDQTSADSDQLAADRDQAASDRDLAAGVDPHEHEATREIRERSARRRDESGQARLEAASRRDEIARSRDLAAEARDQAAGARDLAMAQRDAAYEYEDVARARTGADVVARAAGQRKRAAAHRAHAAQHRALAAEDRRAAARDREQAARERLRALADREALARQVAIAATDALTGVHARAAGLVELDHELDRCERSGSPLVVTYVDVVGLKAVNDSEGHAAGDALLKRVVALIRAHLRTYDLVIRLGGDEFLCVMSGIRVAEARERFTRLAAAPDAPALRTGFAEVAAGERAAELIARADRELIDVRHAS